MIAIIKIKFGGIKKFDKMLARPIMMKKHKMKF